MVNAQIISALQDKSIWGVMAIFFCMTLLSWCCAEYFKVENQKLRKKIKRLKRK
jgi:hypothetical protein